MFQQLRQGCRAAERQVEPAVAVVGEATQVAEVAMTVVVVVMDMDFRSILTGITHLHPSVPFPQGWGMALEVVVMVEVLAETITLVTMRCRDTARMLRSGK